jgi:hypothetical protein
LSRTSWKWEFEEEMMASYYHTFTILTFNLVGGCDGKLVVD